MLDASSQNDLGVVLGVESRCFEPNVFGFGAVVAALRDDPAGVGHLARDFFNSRCSDPAGCMFGVGFDDRVGGNAPF